MMDAERDAIVAAADDARAAGVDLCNAFEIVLALVEDADRRLAGLSWWQRIKMRLRLAVVIPSLRAVHETVCGTR